MSLGMDLTPAELEKIAEIMYNVVSAEACTVFDAQTMPICRLWKHLSEYERSRSIQGLAERIKRETLTGYLARKRREVPQAGRTYDATIRMLRARGFLP